MNRVHAPYPPNLRVMSQAALLVRAAREQMSVGTGARRLSAPGVSTRRATRSRVRARPVTKLPFAGYPYPRWRTPWRKAPEDPGAWRQRSGRAANAALALEVGDLQREDGRHGLGCLSITRSGSEASHEFQADVSLPTGVLGVRVTTMQPLPQVANHMVELVRMTGEHLDHFLTRCTAYVMSSGAAPPDP